MNPPDPSLDLVLDRTVDVPKELVWRAWTEPELLKQWFTPAPWKTVGCEIDLRPGGLFVTVMESPEGEQFPGEGCFLEVVENERLVWTSTMRRGFRPNIQPEGAFAFTAVITIEDSSGGTKYRAHVMHGDQEGRDRHEQMGFHSGWSSALDQLVALMKAL